MTRWLDAAEIRTEYPAPKRSQDGLAAPGTYCVGGALALAMGYAAYATAHVDGSISGAEANRTPIQPPVINEIMAHDDHRYEVGFFPDTPTLAMFLQQANEGLSAEDALAFARRIARKNDTGNFETAWRTLAEALAWTEDESWGHADDATVAAFLEEATA